MTVTLPKRIKEMLKALKSVADDLGLALGPVEGTGHGHFRMMVTRPDGSTFPFVMPKSPSCPRSTQNTIRNLKHMAKENPRTPL